MENITTSRVLGYLMSGGLCVPAGDAAQWHQSARIQDRKRPLSALLVPTNVDVPNNYTTALSAHHVRRT